MMIYLSTTTTKTANFRNLIMRTDVLTILNFNIFARTKILNFKFNLKKKKSKIVSAFGASQSPNKKHFRNANRKLFHIVLIADASPSDRMVIVKNLWLAVAKKLLL